MFETLMYLVGVHAQVCEAAEPLLPRTLNLLSEGLAAEALASFQRVRRFGMGGMLRVRSRLPLTLPHGVLALTTLPLHRPRSRLNSCTRRLAATSRLLQLKPYQSSTTPFHRRTTAGQVTRTSNRAWTA